MSPNLQRKCSALAPLLGEVAGGARGSSQTCRMGPHGVPGARTPSPTPRIGPPHPREAPRAAGDPVEFRGSGCAGSAGSPPPVRFCANLYCLASEKHKHREPDPRLLTTYLPTRTGGRGAGGGRMGGFSRPCPIRGAPGAWLSSPCPFSIETAGQRLVGTGGGAGTFVRESPGFEEVTWRHGERRKGPEGRFLGSQRCRWEWVFRFLGPAMGNRVSNTVSEAVLARSSDRCPGAVRPDTGRTLLLGGVAPLQRANRWGPLQARTSPCQHWTLCRSCAVGYFCLLPVSPERQGSSPVPLQTGALQPCPC